MHKLDRSAVAPPACLHDHDHHTQRWEDLDADCKKLVKIALLRMQGTPADYKEAGTQPSNLTGLRCAYCESEIRHEPHIEHFRRKSGPHPSAYPELTFAWDNLFLSCNSLDHCGHYKDRWCAERYDPELLIKPDEQDPDTYLYFHSTGEVRVRNHSSDAPVDTSQRARETIRVFNLNSTRLQGSRKRAVQVYLERQPGILEALQGFSSEDRRAYVTLELESTRWDAHSSAIKHLLERSLA